MLGWVLLVAGVALLILPGPGIVLVAAGLTVLSQEYPWARSRLKPIRARAIIVARTSVRSWLTVTISVIIPLGAMVIGAIWIWHPPVPAWWSFGDRWWLPGGWGIRVEPDRVGLDRSRSVDLQLLAISDRRDAGHRWLTTARSQLQHS